MNGTNYTAALASLSAEEGIFTTAQAERFGMPRDVLARACAAGKLERITHGAYRSASVASSYLDELVAAWKLTAPSKFSYERMARASWDGIAVGGTTASSVIGIGDFYLSPFRIFSAKRINTRSSHVKFGVRSISRDDVTFEHGLAVTKMERTVVDLMLDDEDLSLVRNAYEDALSKGFDCERLRQIVSGLTPRMRSKATRVLSEAGINVI